MSNPFDAPEAAIQRPPGEAGDFDLGRVLSESWRVTTENLGMAFALPLVMLLVLGVVGTVLGLPVGAVMLAAFDPAQSDPVWAAAVFGGVGALLLLPILLLGAPLTWGWYRAVLDGFDDAPSLGTLFDGYRDLSGRGLPAVGLTFLLLLLALPGTLVSLGLQYGPGLVGLDNVFVMLVGNLVGTVFSLAWSFGVMSRFVPAWILLVDQEIGPMQALSEAWELTSQVWLKCALLQILMSLIAVAGMLLCCVGLLPASFAAAAAPASATRQLLGRDAA